MNGITKTTILKLGFEAAQLFRRVLAEVGHHDSRPGLELTGYFDFYPKNRIQLLGRTEISYSARLDHDLRERVFTKMATPETPCFIVSRGLPIPSEMLEAAEKENIPVLSSNMATTHLSSVITQFLDEKLAPRKSIHGVLVEIYGMGVLIVIKICRK